MQEECFVSQINVVWQMEMSLIYRKLLLPEEQQEALLEAVRDVFAESPFDARPEETLVISGSAEGANEWTAVNCELPTPVADREREDCQSLCA